MSGLVPSGSGLPPSNGGDEALRICRLNAAALIVLAPPAVKDPAEPDMAGIL